MKLKKTRAYKAMNHRGESATFTNEVQAVKWAYDPRMIEITFIHEEA